MIFEMTLSLALGLCQLEPKPKIYNSLDNNSTCENYHPSYRNATMVAGLIKDETEVLGCSLPNKKGVSVCLLKSKATPPEARPYFYHISLACSPKRCALIEILTGLKGA